MLRPNSRIRRVRKCYYGWERDGKVYLSVAPRCEGAAANEYPDAISALKEANERHLPIEWEKK